VDLITGLYIRDVLVFEVFNVGLVSNQTSPIGWAYRVEKTAGTILPIKVLEVKALTL
jgi:hypothetical protein